MEEQMLKVEFAYTDEFNQESRVIKTLTQAVLEGQNTLEMLVNEFKSFLLASGFSNEDVSKIAIKD